MDQGEIVRRYGPAVVVTDLCAVRVRRDPNGGVTVHIHKIDEKGEHIPRGYIAGVNYMKWKGR